MESGNSKNLEIQEMFKIIFNNRLKSGYGKEQARRLAFDAITLRFNLSEERIRKILYMRYDAKGHSSLYYSNNIELISYLKENIEKNQETINHFQAINLGFDNRRIINIINDNIAMLQKKIDRDTELIGYLEEENVYYKNNN